MSTKTKDKKHSSEFWLFVSMLFALVILTLMVLYSPILGKTTENFDASTILDYRSNLFSGLLTAFGAWIGAGAAYFFGRESLKEAYEGMKSLQQPSITERLKQIKIKDIPPKALSWRPDIKDPLQVIFDKLEANPDYWFIPIFDENILHTVQVEEVIWKYYQKKTEEFNTLTEEAKNLTGEEKKEAEAKIENARTFKDHSIEKFLDDIKDDEKFKKFKDQYALLKLTDSLYYANMQLDLKDVKLAIIKDEEGNARYYVTASEFRQYMASIPSRAREG